MLLKWPYSKESLLLTNKTNNLKVAYNVFESNLTLPGRWDVQRVNIDISCKGKQSLSQIGYVIGTIEVFLTLSSSSFFFSHSIYSEKIKRL